MAKNKSQTISLVQAAVDLFDTINAFGAGDFSTDCQALLTAIEAGDNEAEDSELLDAARTVLDSMNSLAQSINSLALPLSKSLGRYAGSPNLNDQQTNLEYFNEKLIADSEAVETRGFSGKTTATPDGSNVGTGTMLVYDLDPSGQTADIAHIEAVTLRCVHDATESGISAGNERFLVTGESAEGNAWEEVGTGDSGGTYQTPFNGSGANALNPATPIVTTGDEITVASGNSTSENLLLNGGFEQTFGASSSSTKISGWTISTGTPGDITAETSNPIAGSQSLRFAGDATLTQELTGLVPHAPYAVRLLADGDPSVSAGTVKLRIIDDSSTHAEASITISTSLQSATAAFIAPDRAGVNLRVELEVDSLAGDDVLVDEVVLTPMKLFDSGRAFAIIAGPVPFRYNDEFVNTVTSTDAGKVQRFWNRVFGAYATHDSTAVDWVDP
jgi:hypothetical protein